MSITLGDLEKTVTLKQVLEVLEGFQSGDSGRHQVDLGDFGYEYLDCDHHFDIDEVLKKLV